MNRAPTIGLDAGGTAAYGIAEARAVSEITVDHVAQGPDATSGSDLATVKSIVIR